MVITKSISSYTSASTLKSKLLAGSYDSCFTHLLLRVWGRLARFIYWRQLNHFFLPVYAGVYLPHTIKSAVFLLIVLSRFCGKRCIKSTPTGSQYCRVLSDNHGCVTPCQVCIAMLLLTLTPTFSYCSNGSSHILLGIGRLIIQSLTLLQSLSGELLTHIGMIPIYEMSVFYLFSI